MHPIVMAKKAILSLVIVKPFLPLAVQIPMGMELKNKILVQMERKTKICT